MLTGNKTYFAPLEEDHLQKRVDWINDPDVQATLNFSVPVSYAGTKKWFDSILLDQSRRDFSLFVSEGSILIGFGGFINIDPVIEKAELYVTIGEKDYWGGGYGTDAYATLTRYGFEEMGLNKVYGYQLTHNHGAHRVIEKLGWKRDGLLRDDILSHGKVIDRYIVSILREEWVANDQ